MIYRGIGFHINYQIQLFLQAKEIPHHLVWKTFITFDKTFKEVPT